MVSLCAEASIFPSGLIIESGKSPLPIALISGGTCTFYEDEHALPSRGSAFRHGSTSLQDEDEGASPHLGNRNRVCLFHDTWLSPPSRWALDALLIRLL